MTNMRAGGQEPLDSFRLGAGVLKGPGMIRRFGLWALHTTISRTKGLEIELIANDK